MKRLIPLLSLAIAVLVAGCSKKSTTPDQKPPTEDYTLEASQTIGSEGGSIEAEDFSLTVPKGALDSDAELKLYASSKDKPFGDNCMSRTFRLEGLPDEYSEPLQLSIKYQGTLSDSSFIAVGEEAMVAGSDELETAYQMLSATDSTGCLHCELPASEGDKASPKAGGRHTLAGSSKSRKFTTASKYLKKYHFFTKYYEIWLPSGVSVSITELADLLDETYKTFMDMGFSINYVPHVIVNFNTENFYCKFRYRNRDKYGCLDVNAENLTPEDLPKMRVMIGREIFRVIQFTYDPNYPVMVGPAQQDYYWLNEATLSWSEEKFVPAEERRNYVPIDFPGNEMAPFNGMQTGIHAGEGNATTKAKNHGWGMSSMIEFFTDRYYLPDSILYFIHRKLYRGQHPVEAVLNCIQGELYNEWWHKFLLSYVENYNEQDIYNVSSDVFTQKENISGVFDIESDDDTLATFKGTYPDLSAKLYRVNLKHKTISKNAEIIAKAIYSDDIYKYVKIFAFKFVYGKHLQIIDHGPVNVWIENVKELTDEGTDIIIMVVNSSYHPPHYTTNSDIDLEVRVITEELWGCTIWFELNGYFRTIWDIPDMPDTNHGWREWWPNWDHVTGSFSGNNFDVDWDTTDCMGDPYSGSMRIKFNATRDTVKSFVASAKYIREYGNAQLSFNGWDVPLRYGSVSDNPYYRVGGEETCDHIGQFFYRWQSGSVTDTLLYDECNAESYMSIGFYKIE